MNPRPTNEQVRDIKSRRDTAMATLDLETARLMSQWLYAYVYGPNAWRTDKETN